MSTVDTATVNLPRTQTIFGREPVMFLGLIETVLTFALAFGLGISQDVFGPLMAVVAAAVGLYTAWATTETRLSAIVGFMRAALVLFAVWGLTLTDAQTAALMGLTTVVFSWMHRDRTSPLPVEPTPVAPTPVTPAPVVPPVPAEDEFPTDVEPNSDDVYDPEVSVPEDGSVEPPVDAAETDENGLAREFRKP